MSLDLAPRPLPLLTADLAGTGGVARVAPEDFLVEELPAYLPGGAGEHLYLFIEKRGLSTVDAVGRLAHALGADPREAGYAGQKDRHAIARQWVSLHTPARAPALDDPSLKILAEGRHTNRIRLGHLKGNRFLLTLRETVPDAVSRAQAILDALGQTGLANFYGEQRFGRRGDNAALGAALLGLGSHPDLARAKRDRHLRRLAISALQSELFNRCLTDRIAAGLWDRVLAGDVLRKRLTGGLFVCDDAAANQERLRSGEIDVAGPMPGHRERLRARGEALAREERVLAEAGVSREAFAAAKGEGEGAWRAYRAPVQNAAVRAGGAGAVELSFELPGGSYATRVLAEVTKADVTLPGGA